MVRLCTEYLGWLQFAEFRYFIEALFAEEFRDQKEHYPVVPSCKDWTFRIGSLRHHFLGLFGVCKNYHESGRERNPRDLDSCFRFPFNSDLRNLSSGQ